MTKQNNHEHHQWIDLAKFSAIFLVVLFHSPPSISGTVAGVLLSHLHVPAFFFLAGLLFHFEKYSSFTDFVKYRSKQLLIPYFCFFILFYLFWLLVGRRISSPEEMNLPIYTPVLEYVYGRPLLVCWPLWFIAALFSTQCLFYLFRKLHRLVSVVILLLLPILPHLIDMSHAPWMLGEACEYLPLYGIAALYSKEFLRFMEKKNRFLIALLFLIIHFVCNFQLLEQQNEYVKIPFNLLCSFCAIIPFFVLIKIAADRFGVHRTIKYIGTNTIIVLAFHTFVIRLIVIFSDHVLHLADTFWDDKYILKFAIAIFATISMLIPIYIINRYFPFIIGRKRLLF
jgi:fucose 4-O-acetylase-like acetyltransferase